MSPLKFRVDPETSALRSSVHPVGWFSSLSIGIATVLALLFPGYSRAFAAVPLAVGGLTIGMSHGAADFFLIHRRSGNARWRFWTPLLGYMLIMAGMTVWWLAHSLSVLIVFLALTLVHFGSEEADHWQARQGWKSNQARVRWPLLIGHGTLVVAMPILWHPLASEAFLSRVLAIGFSDPSQAIGMIPSTPSSLLVCVGIVVTCCVWVFIQLRSATDLVGRSLQSWKPSLIWALQTTLLAIAGFCLNPEFFIGLYLLVWHAPRHYRALHHSSHGKLSLLWRDTFVFQLPAVTAIAALVYAASRSSDITVLAATSAAVVLTYLVVTPPHHLLQESRRQRTTTLVHQAGSA